MANTLTAEQCRTALRRRFSQGKGFVHLEELPNVGGLPGPEGLRRCDFWAMSVYGSRGYETHGVEIKTSLSDLRAELQEPKKAEGLSEFCDYWWLAVGDRDLVRHDRVRVPKSWGVLWPRGQKLVQKDGPERTPSRDAWDRAFVAALVKRCWSPHQENRITRLKQQHHRELREARREGRVKGKEAEREKCRELRERVEAFEAASGIDLSGRPYSFRREYGIREDVGRRLGRVVSVLMRGGGDLERHLDAMRSVARKARERAGTMEEAAEDLERFVSELQDRQTDLSSSAADPS